ncbi:MAG: hypothetical protein ACPL7O_04310, partial [Armatimonadota bacterium]
GVITVSRSSIPAPTVSPLNNSYCQEIQAIANRLNGLSNNSEANADNGAIEVHLFESASDALGVLQEILREI